MLSNAAAAFRFDERSATEGFGGLGGRAFAKCFSISAQMSSELELSELLDSAAVGDLEGDDAVSSHVGDRERFLRGDGLGSDSDDDRGVGVAGGEGGGVNAGGEASGVGTGLGDALPRDGVALPLERCSKWFIGGNVIK